MISKSSNGKDKPSAPILLHFDINNTVLQSDSSQMKTIEVGIREGVAELYWGRVTIVDGKQA